MAKPPLPSPCQCPLSEPSTLSPCAPPPPSLPAALQLLGSLRSLQHPNSDWTFPESKAVRAGLSEGWHSSCIFGALCAFLRKDPNTEPALGMASLLPHGWLLWILLPKDTGIQEHERHFSLRPANCHIMPSNRQTPSLQRC